MPIFTFTHGAPWPENRRPNALSLSRSRIIYSQHVTQTTRCRVVRYSMCLCCGRCVDALSKLARRYIGYPSPRPLSLSLSLTLSLSLSLSISACRCDRRTPISLHHPIPSPLAPICLQTLCHAACRITVPPAPPSHTAPPTADDYDPICARFYNHHAHRECGGRAVRSSL